MRLHWPKIKNMSPFSLTEYIITMRILPLDTICNRLNTIQTMALRHSTTDSDMHSSICAIDTLRIFVCKNKEIKMLMFPIFFSIHLIWHESYFSFQLFLNTMDPRGEHFWEYLSTPSHESGCVVIGWSWRNTMYVLMHIYFEKYLHWILPHTLYYLFVFLRIQTLVFGIPE